MEAKRHPGIYLLAGAFAAVSFSLFPTLTHGSQAATHAGKSPLCDPADLGSIKDGSYPVFYLSPDGSQHAIGTADIHSSASAHPTLHIALGESLQL